MIPVGGPPVDSASPPASLVPSGTEVEVVVIVVSYNSSTHIGPFVRSIRDALQGVTSSRVVLVDNASTDGTIDVVRRLAPWVEIVVSDENRGYAGAINLVLAQFDAISGYLVVNPDSILSTGAALALTRVALGAGVGVAFPQVLDEAGGLKHSMRREPSIGIAAIEALLGGRTLGRRFGEVVRDDRAYVEGASPDWATGAALFIASEVVDAIGLWDERFFLYSEETDYALRAKDAGFSPRLTLTARVVHPGGAMEESPWLWSLVAVNRARLYAKRHRGLSPWVFWGVVVLNEALRSLRRRPTHRAALKALLQVGPRMALDPSDQTSTSVMIVRASRRARRRRKRVAGTH